MEQSIFRSIIQRLGLDVSDVLFKEDVIQAINSAMVDLTMIGVGPREGFRIENDVATWTDFIGSTKLLDSVKDYIYIQCRLVFDPPTAATITSFQELAEKHLWKCRTNVEQPPLVE